MTPSKRFRLMAASIVSNLETRATFVDCFTKIVGVVALVVGAVWAGYRFSLDLEQSEIERQHVWNLQLSVRSELVDTKGDPVLLVTVYLKNIGKVAVQPHLPADRPGGLLLTVYEHGDISMENTEGEDAEKLIEWSKGVSRMVNFDMLSRYRANYVIPPGAEYREVEAVRVERDKWYGLRARFYVDDDGEYSGSTSDSQFVFVPDPDSN